jgi:uncharacterized membrane protein SpoIIM required for sporulation
VTAPASRPAPALRSAQFRKGREAAWRQLDDLLTRIEKKGLERLSAEELTQLPLLYRTAASSLSIARSIALDRNLILYLENLTLRGYFVVYGPRTSVIEGLAGFLKRDFPRAVRASGWHVLFAFLAIVVGVAIGYGLVDANEHYFSLLAPQWLTHGRGPSSTAAELRDGEIFAPWPGFEQSFIVFASFLFQHNTMIGIMTFGLGVFAGAPTLLLLLYQGLTFGAFVALHQHRRLLLDFLGWASIHGVTEFGALILCGAGGFVVAEKILFPGRSSRRDNLALQGASAARLAGGAVFMLFAAGLIEGGLRQLINDTPARFVFALASAVAWLAYFLLAGKSDDARA